MFSPLLSLLRLGSKIHFLRKNYSGKWIHRIKESQSWNEIKRMINQRKRILDVKRNLVMEKVLCNCVIKKEDSLCLTRGYGNLNKIITQRLQNILGYRMEIASIRTAVS